jgi:hypothetical protein
MLIRSIRSISVGAVALAFISVAAAAAQPQCTVHPPKGTPESALAGMTKITEADARKTALAGFAKGSAEIAEAELEVEHGCLIYSFDVKSAGNDGIDEVQIDAGSGQTLGRKHESSAEEAAESAEEKRESAAKQ